MSPCKTISRAAVALGVIAAVMPHVGCGSPEPEEPVYTVPEGASPEEISPGEPAAPPAYRESSGLPGPPPGPPPVQ